MKLLLLLMPIFSQQIVTSSIASQNKIPLVENHQILNQQVTREQEIDGMATAIKNWYKQSTQQEMQPVQQHVQHVQKQPKYKPIKCLSPFIGKTSKPGRGNVKKLAQQWQVSHKKNNN